MKYNKNYVNCIKSYLNNVSGKYLSNIVCSCFYNVPNINNKIKNGDKN